MTTGGRTSTTGAGTTMTGGPMMTAECRCHRRPPSSATIHPLVARRVMKQANENIVFIFKISFDGHYPMLERRRHAV